MLSQVPAGRAGTAEEFGSACAFLCSRQAGYITGQNLLIDGGLVQWVFDRDRLCDEPGQLACVISAEGPHTALAHDVLESVWMNDQSISMEQVSEIVAPLYAASDRHLVISVRADRETPYSFIDAVQKELVAAGVVRVVFATQLERQSVGVRR